MDKYKTKVEIGGSDKPLVHYIAMAGLHGFLPQVCDVFDTFDDAVQYLSEIHELGEKRQAMLSRNGYLELRNDGDRFPFVNDGNEYCEITDCNCKEPEVHSDSQ